MSVVVRDPGAGVFSRTETQVAVPGFRPGSVSAPVLVYRAKPRPDLWTEPDILLNPRGTVAHGGDSLTVLVEAYGLTPRERDVVRAIARGTSTPQIAAELFLSAHTVRDYIKSVFDKVDVTSRTELVAKLFADHYADPFHETLVHLH